LDRVLVVGPVGIVVQAVLEGIHRGEKVQEGGGILGQVEDTSLEGRHMAYQEIQDRGDRHDPSQLVEEGRMEDTGWVDQKKGHPEGHPEVEDRAAGSLAAEVLVDSELGPVLETVPGDESRSVEKVKSAI
jgi:hypothetical protein